MKSIADLPNQIMQQSDHRFNGKSHPRLPIRSLDKGCSNAEQYMPTRSSERLDEMDRWMDHFEAAKKVPIHTVTLEVDSLDVTRWWRDFFVEIGVLSKHDKVFKDLICT